MCDASPRCSGPWCRDGGTCSRPLSGRLLRTRRVQKAELRNGSAANANQSFLEFLSSAIGALRPNKGCLGPGTELEASRGIRPTRTSCRPETEVASHWHDPCREPAVLHTQHMSKNPKPSFVPSCRSPTERTSPPKRVSPTRGLAMLRPRKQSQRRQQRQRTQILLFSSPRCDTFLSASGSSL